MPIVTAGKYERPPEVEEALAALPPPDDEGYLDALGSTLIEAVVVVHCTIGWSCPSTAAAPALRMWRPRSATGKARPAS